MKVLRAAILLTLVTLPSGCHWIFPYGPARDAKDLPDLTSRDVRDVRGELAPPLPARPVKVSLLAGDPGNPGSADGAGSSASFNLPEEIALDRTATAASLYVADSENHSIRKVDPSSGEVSTHWSSTNIYTNGIALKRAGGTVKMWVSTRQGGIFWLEDGQLIHQTPRLAPGSFLYGNAVRDSSQGAELFVAEARPYPPKEFYIRRVFGAPKQETVVHYAGGAAGFNDGDPLGSLFRFPNSMVFSKGGQTLYVTDRDNHRIRRIDTVNNKVDTVVGTGARGDVDGSPNEATLCHPEGITIDDLGYLYITEVGPATVAGDMQCQIPDECGHRVRRISPGDFRVETLTSGGRGVPPAAEPQPVEQATFCEPTGIAVLPDGRIFVADTGNHVIRVLQ